MRGFVKLLDQSLDLGGAMKVDLEPHPDALDDDRKGIQVVGADGVVPREVHPARDGPGLRDEGLTADGRYLYALDADAGTIFGWAVGERGALSPIGSWGGLPATVAGLAAT